MDGAARERESRRGPWSGSSTSRPSRRQLWLVLGSKPRDTVLARRGGWPDARVRISHSQSAGTTTNRRLGVGGARAGPPGSVEFSAAVHERLRRPRRLRHRAIPAEPPAPRWPQEVTTTITRSTAKDAYVVDDIALPLDNPWRRNVRLSDIQFLEDGTGVGVTLDGDVWFIRGLDDRGGVGPLAAVRVRPARAADARDSRRADVTSSIATASGGCATRTATARPTSTSCSRTRSRRRPTCASSRARSGSRPAASSSSRRAGRRRRRSASTTAACCASRPTAGRRRSSATDSGSRSIGVNLRTGLVTASDQQGNYIPSTPLHIVRDEQFYGFLSDKLPRKSTRRRSPTRSRGFRTRSTRRRCRRCGCSARAWVRSTTGSCTSGSTGPSCFA